MDQDVTVLSRITRRSTHSFADPTMGRAGLQFVLLTKSIIYLRSFCFFLFNLDHKFQVLLSACFYAASTRSSNQDSLPVSSTTTDDSEEVSFFDSSVNLQLLQKRLCAVMGKHIPLEHVNKFVYLCEIEKYKTLVNRFYFGRRLCVVVVKDVI